MDLLGYAAILLFACLCHGEEAPCSRFHYEKQTIEKIVRLEHRFEQLEAKINSTGIVAGVKTECDDNWIVFQGSCYLFGHEAHDFIEANKFCEHQHAHLVRIDGAVESTFIQSWMVRLKDAKFWIGLNDLVTEGIWQWYDSGTTATYYDWNPGEPNQNTAANCVSVREDYGYNWVDDPCDRHYYTLCEKTNQKENEIIG